jgi:hypothetical protein
METKKFRALTPAQNSALEGEKWNATDYKTNAAVFVRVQYAMRVYGSFDEDDNFSCRTSLSLAEKETMLVLAEKLNWKTTAANS